MHKPRQTSKQTNFWNSGEYGVRLPCQCIQATLTRRGSTVIWFQVFSYNGNNLYAITWFQVVNDNNNNSRSQVTEFQNRL